MRVALVRGGLLALTLLLTLALSSTRRDTTPPELFAEAIDRAPVGVPFELFVSASEPVTYRLTYGELELAEVTQDLTVSLLALPGKHRIRVVAVDGSGNESGREFTVEGVEAVTPLLSAPEQVEAGDPLSAALGWSDTGAELLQATLELGGGGPSITVPSTDGIRLIATVPLGSADALWPIEARLVDEFGREAIAADQIRVIAGRQPVEELNVPASTLSVITPAGRQLEREAFETAYAESLADPLWSGPFLLPIEGRSTSGFGYPRRYAPGGPVSFHEGSDIGASEGTPIVATNEGVVRIAGFYPIKGGLTIIDHGAGVSSLYFHQSRILVEAGERVAAGQQIGEVGSTGLSTGPHLHWEMRVGRVPSNPMAWVGKVWP